MKKGPAEYSRANPSLFQEGARTLTRISQPAPCVPPHVEEEKGFSWGLPDDARVPSSTLLLKRAPRCQD